MKTALVYDRVNKWGGAERVLLALHEMFPEAPLFTSVYDPENAPWANVFPKIYTSFLQKSKYARTHHEQLAVFMPLVYESFSFDEYDLVISVSSEAAKGIITKPGTFHIAYCLTPTRYLWSGYDIYFRNPLLRIVSYPFVQALRKWDKIAAKRTDITIAISSEVKRRITKYYGERSQVIFPPAGFDKPVKEVRKGNFYLIVNRLVPYKKVDLAIRAFNKLGLPLRIIGVGSESIRLKLMAKGNIKFLNEVSDTELISNYERAKALIFPQEEDFGIVPVEAQSLGTPVIAYKKGGVLDTVIEEKTGIFFAKQTTESLIEAVKRFNKMKFNQEDLIANAEKFSKGVFKQKLLSIIKNTI